jgi:predicted nucleotide-binding protein (sugar kinase/HSP70/actin superfamily)
VVRSASLIQPVSNKILAPTVHFKLGPEHVRKELAEFANKMFGTKKRENERAVNAAYVAQADFSKALLAAGANALSLLSESDEPALILVGRPYNIYDRSVNCDIPRKLRQQYGVNVVPLDFLPLEDEDILEINDNMYWNSGRRILAAARIANRNPNLHLVFISNFKCGPDSYIKSFVDDAAGKPGLVLQFDGHANDAGFITRCEAYLDSKGFLRCPSAISTPVAG